MESCVKEILSEIDFVQKIGAPGRIIVFGKNSEAVLTGRQEEDTVIAAAELGKGRIVVFSHTGFGKQMCDQTGDFTNSILYKNVRNWVTKKNKNTSYNILKLDTRETVKNIEDLQKYDIVFSVGGKENIKKELIEKYIELGGAFVIAATPWGWLQCNNNKPIYEIPYSSILLKVGISFSKDLAKDHGSGFETEISKGATANISKMNDNFQDLNSMLEKVSLLKMISELPVECANQLSTSVLKHWKEVEKEIKTKFPHGKLKTTNMHEREILEFWTLCASIQSSSEFKAPCINEFPGDFDVLPPLKCKRVKFNSKREDYFFTGCYVAAGTVATLKVSAIKSRWKVLVGAHTDYLTSAKISRWPDIVKRIDACASRTYDISSPFGGGVYFLSSKSQDSKIEATISNIVLQPLYDSEDLNSKRSWKENINSPGLWADIMGKYITFTFPSESIRHLQYPSEILNLFDNLLEAYHDLRGSKIDDYRKIWVVADIQPSVGYMHSGNPIVTQLDVTKPSDMKFLLNADNFKAGFFWGLFHEIGHNMQKSDWTFEGTSEVTVNIFTLYGMQTMCHIPAWIHPWLQKQFNAAFKYLKAGADFAKWKRGPGLALVVYAQLAHHFTWDAYKQVFRNYNNLNPSLKPKSNQDKIDMWFETFSRVVGYNLEPLFIFWGIPLTENQVKKVKTLKLPCFLPDDEVTREVPDRVSFVKATFPYLIREL